MTHFPGHQQALIKDNIVIAVISFSEHKDFEQTFSKFEYDLVIDLCSVNQDAYIGSAWDGQRFNIRKFQSWSLGEDLDWHPPFESPGLDFWWDEALLVWKPLAEALEGKDIDY